MKGIDRDDGFGEERGVVQFAMVERARTLATGLSVTIFGRFLLPFGRARGSRVACDVRVLDLGRSYLGGCR